MYNFNLDGPDQSVTDYIIINDRLKSNIEDTRVFRGREIDSDHKLVESKFKFLTHAKNIATIERIKQYTKYRQHLRYICWNTNQ